MIYRMMAATILIAGVFGVTMLIAGPAGSAKAQEAEAGGEGEEHSDGLTEAHQQLGLMVGEWDTVQTVAWGEEPMSFAGTMTGSALFGGRFVRATYITPMSMGEGQEMVFEGESTLGFDDFRNVFASSWIDNMGNAFYGATGTALADGSLRLFGQGDDVWAQPAVVGTHFRYDYTWEDADTFTMSMYDLAAGDDAGPIMTIRHERADSGE